jgi:uncharacterized protein YutE (UPF0331/DUF86 family)
VTPAEIDPRIVAERSAWVREMISSIRLLPLESLEAFEQDPRNAAAAESYLRRALEGLLDLGRHILAKGYGRAAAEYKDIAIGLMDVGVLDSARGARLREMAGYRNRLVHFYRQVDHTELFELCAQRLDDVENTLDAILAAIRR